VLALAAPFGDDTVAMLLDGDRRGVGIVVVTGTTDPDAIFRVIAACGNIRRPEIAALILATSRPGGDLVVADRDRWLEASLQCDAAGLELVEWFVIGTHVACPRELAGDPPRWSRR
jgi:hypothetical protein